MLARGDVYRIRHPQGDPKKSRCFVIVSRQTLINSRATQVLCAPINTARNGIATEVNVGTNEGLKHDSCINCDQLMRVEKTALTDYIGSLSSPKLHELRNALLVAMDLK